MPYIIFSIFFFSTSVFANPPANIANIQIRPGTTVHLTVNRPTSLTCLSSSAPQCRVVPSRQTPGNFYIEYYSQRHNSWNVLTGDRSWTLTGINQILTMFQRSGQCR